MMTKIPRMGFDGGDYEEAGEYEETDDRDS
jgi:hypothetical protein